MLIKNIQEVQPRMVYAIETSTGTFIADGLAHHNCKKCNRFQGGREARYAEYIIKHYGLDKFEELMMLERIPFTGSKALFLLEQKEIYKHRLSELKKQRGIR